jgi:hypothetical protein
MMHHEAAVIGISVHLRSTTQLRVIRHEQGRTSRAFVAVRIGSDAGQVDVFVSELAEMQRLAELFEQGRTALAELLSDTGSGLGAAWEAHDDPEVNLGPDEPVPLVPVATGGE